MRSVAGLAALVLLTIPLAGCMDLFTEEVAQKYEGRVLPPIHLEINSGTSDTIPLYTMNNGQQMMSVAMGFTKPGDDVAVPNPPIKVKEGDTVTIIVTNNNPLPHTFHLHGGLVDWDMDGVPFLTQKPINQGESYTYVYKNMKAGTYFYHCHVDVAHHMDLGMYGSFIVEEVDPTYEADVEYVLMLDEWDNCHVHGNTDPVDNAENNAAILERAECLSRFAQDNYAQNQATNPVVSEVCRNDPPEEVAEELQCDKHMRDPPTSTPREWYPMSFPTYTPDYNTYLINGKAFPDTKPLIGEEGQTMRLRLINVGEEIHSMHLHGHKMLVTHRDGYELPAPFYVDTLGIMPGERYDVVFELDNPGLWAFHDHVALNVMNDHQSPGGMFTCVAYDNFSYNGASPVDARSFDTAMDCLHEAMDILGAEHH